MNVAVNVTLNKLGILINLKTTVVDQGQLYWYLLLKLYVLSSFEDQRGLELPQNFMI